MVSNFFYLPLYNKNQDMKSQKKLKKQVKKLNYMLGEQVGQQIVDNFLVSLSTEMVQTSRVVQVSKEETDEYQRLSDAHTNLWYAKKMPNHDEECTQLFYVAREYHHQLEKKYLPETIKATVLHVSPTNLKAFKKGINDTIWDSDISNYSLAEDFFIRNPKISWCSYINLVRDEKIIQQKLA